MGALRKSNTRYFRNRSCGSRVFPLVAKQMSRKQVNRPSSMSHLMTYWLSTWLCLKVLHSGMHFVSDRQSVSSNPASDDTDLHGYFMVTRLDSTHSCHCVPWIFTSRRYVHVLPFITQKELRTTWVWRERSERHGLEQHQSILVVIWFPRVLLNLFLITSTFIRLIPELIDFL